VVWTTPVFLSGWLGTGSVAGAILQLVTVAVMTLIWVPFLIVMDRGYLKEEKAEAALNEQATSETINQRVEER